MRSHAGAPPSRRRFLALSAGGAVAGAAALNGCALPVSGSVGGGGESITMMVSPGDITPDQVRQAKNKLGISVELVKWDITKLIAMLTSGNPPDLVRGVGAVDAAYFAARDTAENLDPYFARSTVLRAADLDPVNDLWRFDGRTQGKGPRYGMAKDFSQDSMYWYNTAVFDKAGITYPSETEPVTFEQWQEDARRLVQRKRGQTIVFGGSYAGLTRSTLLATMTASAGGSLFDDDFSRVDFTTPEARKALAWYIDYCHTKVGPSLIQPDPNGWDGPTYQAGRMAMSNSGYWLGGMIGTDPKLAAVSRLAPAPVFAGGPRISACQGGTGLWMPKKAKNKDAAWRVFEWFFGEEPAKERAAGGWGIPTLKSLRALMPHQETYQQRTLKVQENELKHYSVVSFTPYTRADALDALFNQAAPAAMNGGISVDRLAGQLNDVVNEQLKRGKEQVG
ncbi:extracellular solute-binding protein [Streptomyces acidiscabies]|uniref:Extracellular solute-binding protein n=1 Tax=Streptomyces acidiscabies TaxID=42234 RepID=A0AAP6EFK4_9ACTN|nr:extracellular solute-binding protein [Streptomyces acidiscabies]MBP5936124.1 extracellular solute-binding protein [Streptomyces sp. LBUM 1476]MBZ3915943.1 extracellular solute-binding protein [Streptomyces acidiscabies]MDX2960336.1 extracellular solute-binding protein [Streptomyces acidiscabies]MDX3023760.1 extracellular solute-binding protein [Streptomyces acidiscabies]MDX3793993.1 extracellular solute-binding protein [Streptomyces acidiscabies]